MFIKILKKNNLITSKRNHGYYLFSDINYTCRRVNAILKFSRDVVRFLKIVNKIAPRKRIYLVNVHAHLFKIVNGIEPQKHIGQRTCGDPSVIKCDCYKIAVFRLH